MSLFDQPNPILLGIPLSPVDAPYCPGQKLEGSKGAFTLVLIKWFSTGSVTAVLRGLEEDALSLTEHDEEVLKAALNDRISLKVEKERAKLKEVEGLVE
jgi:hypothetical protein